MRYLPYLAAGCLFGAAWAWWPSGPAVAALVLCGLALAVAKGGGGRYGTRS